MDNSKKIILDLCGGTGAWSKPYKDAGYDVRIITAPKHDVRDLVAKELDTPTNEIFWDVYTRGVYGVIAAPPCTMFSFARTNAKEERNLKKGIEIVDACQKAIWAFQYNLPSPYAKKTKLKFWAIENPNGFLKYFLGHPVMEFAPYEFGDPYKKKTQLWGWFNKPKKIEGATKPNTPKFDQTLMKDFHGSIPEGYEVPPDSNKRKVIRSITPPAFAAAFFEANQ